MKKLLAICAGVVGVCLTLNARTSYVWNPNASLMGTIVNSQSRAIATFLVGSVHPCLSADDARFQICQ